MVKKTLNIKRKERDLFSVKSGPRNKVVKKKTQKIKDSGDGLEQDITVPEDRINVIAQYQCITEKTLSEGQCFLGCVVQIDKYELCISLPYGLVGYVPIKNISKAYKSLLLKVSEDEDVDNPVHDLKELFRVGQMLLTTVESLKSKERLTNSKNILSIVPEDVNTSISAAGLIEGCVLQGAVADETDNGYVIETGIPNVRAAFLPKKNAPLGTVGVGSVVLCAVTEADPVGESGVSYTRLKLTTKVKFMRNEVIERTHFKRIITAGTWITAKIEKIQKDGLVLSIRKHSTGFVSSSQLSTPNTKVSEFKPGEERVFRVLCVNSADSVIYCSLSESILKGKSLVGKDVRPIRVGDKINDCKIISASDKELKFEVQDPDDGIPFIGVSGFPKVTKRPNSTPAERVDELKTMKKKFVVGALADVTVRCVHLMDRQLNLTVKYTPETVGSLEIGSVHSVKILSHTTQGVMVLCKQTIQGFVPSIQMENRNDKEPKELYPVDGVFKARVIECGAKQNPIFTLKDDMIKSRLPVFEGIGKSLSGKHVVGVVNKVNEKSMHVLFYSGMKVKIPKKNVPPEILKKTEEELLGKVVKCKISSSKSNSKIKASLILNKLNVTDFCVGNFVNGKVETVKHDQLVVRVDGSLCRALIPLIHLHDDLDYAKSFYKLINPEDVITNAMVYKIEGKVVYLTLKSLLYRCEKNLDRNRQILPAVISECHPNKICLSYVDGVSKKCVVSKNEVFEDGVLNLELKGLDVGRVVYFTNKKQEDGDRFNTCKLSNVMKDKQSSFQILYDNLMAEKYIADNFQIRRKLYSKFSVGEKYNASVMVISKFGSFLHIPTLNLNAVLTCEQYGTVCPTVGKGIQVKALRFDAKELCLEVTAKFNLKKVFQYRSPSVELGEVCVGEVILRKSEFILIRLGAKHKGQLVYAPSRRHQNDLDGRYPFYEVGKMYEFKIKYVEENLVLADYLAHCEGKQDPLILDKEKPELDFQTAIYLKSLKSCILDDKLLTKADFRNKAREKINRVSQTIYCGTKKTILSSPKRLIVLKKDDFPEFSETKYQILLDKTRKERKLKEKAGIIKKENKKAAKVKAKEPKPKQVEKTEVKGKEPQESGKKKIKEQPTPKKTKNSKEEQPKGIEKTEVKGKEPQENGKKRTKGQPTPKKIENSKEEQQPKGTENTEVKKPKRKMSESEIENSQTKKPKGKSIKSDADGTKSTKLKSSESGSSPSSKKLKSKANTLNENVESDKFVFAEEVQTSDLQTNDCLQVQSKGFDWSGRSLEITENGDVDSSSSEDEATTKEKEQKSVKRLSKYEKEKLRSAEERKTRELELQRIEEGRQPATAMDFEERIERNPHSSAVWIEYVSFQLENAEKEKAKAVVSRALSIVPPNLEDERLALWNVALKLEVMYGSPEEIQNSFKEASQTNDEKKVYNLMVDIYSGSNKYKDAEYLLRTMTKRFSSDKEVWIKAGQFFFEANKLADARNVLDRSLLSLPKTEHVDVIHRFAQLELKLGDPERGRTVYETVLSNYPKRLDIWNTYADILVKLKDIKGARDILERMLGLKLRMNAMRNVFKKLLEFEKVHGTPQRIEAVKARVEEYVAAALKPGE